MTDRRFSLQALVSASGLTEAALGRKVGLSGSTLKSARSRGLTESAADRYACRAGLMPWEVWPEWLPEARVQCAASDCAELFLPRDSRHLYHSPTCRQREKMRRYRATEHGAATVRAVRRRYLSDPKVRKHEAKVKRDHRAAERRRTAA